MLTPAGKKECGFEAYTSIYTSCVLAETVLNITKQITLTQSMFV